jgi:hypothetical protein
MPQARSSGSGSSSGGSSGPSQTRRSTGARSAGTRSTGAKKTTRSSSSGAASKPRSRASSASSASSASTASSTKTDTAADPRLEAMAQRVRKLNERIINESKSAGEATLTAYEKALKSIASSLERGPGESDVEWISALATTQAKWIRDVTTAWTSAARGMLK